jgi:hypothetical protein
MILALVFISTGIEIVLVVLFLRALWNSAGQETPDARARGAVQVPKSSPASAAPLVTPGWLADPLGMADARYFDGQAWTERVRRGAEEFTDLRDVEAAWFGLSKERRAQRPTPRWSH